jgi:transcriptional regulator with XRE-family HTH domain
MEQETVNIARQLVGQYLREVREGKNMTIYAVEKASGLDLRQIKAIESGESSYTIDSFIRLIQALDVYFFLSEKGKKKDGFKFSKN